MPRSIEFESAYTAELIDEAATAYVRQYFFKRYGRWLVAACILNAGGLAFAFGQVSWWLAACLGLVVALGPLYLAYAYFLLPARLASRLKQRLLPTVRFSLGESEIEASTKSGSGTVPWSRVKSVFQLPSFFILVIAPMVFLVIPTAGLPTEGAERLSSCGSASAA